MSTGSPQATPHRRTAAPRHDRPTPATAFSLARAKFLAGERVDINDLADELAVNRVTIYRWLGSRQTLLAEIVWSLAEPTLARCEAQAAGRGGKRVAAILGAFIRLTLAHPAMRRFLTQESDTALRVLTRGDKPFQPKLIGAVQTMLEAERAAGHLNTPIPVQELASILVRVGEAFVYTDTITGEPADAQRAERALAYILR